MNSFSYYNPTKIIFGDNSIEQLIDLIPDDCERILLHYGGGSIKKFGLYNKILNILDQKSVKITELPGVEPNPKLNLVREGIRICKNNEIDFILAVGGGSVIDSAKAIAAGALCDNDIWSCFLGKDTIQDTIPIGVVLTIPATGSETSPNSIITNEDGMFKMGIKSDSLRPQFAILNPELTLTLPAIHTFAGIVDIMSHVMERYFTNTENVELTEGMSEATLRTVIKNAYKLKENPNDYNARSEIMLCGTIAHGGILGLGREEDWGSHKIAHEITALYGTTHGITLSIVLPAWMKYVYKENVQIFVNFAQNVFNVKGEEKTLEKIALEGIRKFEDFLLDMGMPITFSQYNIPTNEFDIMAEKATKGSYIGNLKKLYKEDVINIFNLAKGNN